MSHRTYQDIKQRAIETKNSRRLKAIEYIAQLDDQHKNKENINHVEQYKYYRAKIFLMHCSKDLVGITKTYRKIENARERANDLDTNNNLWEIIPPY